MLPLIHLDKKNWFKVRDIRQYIRRDERVVFTGKIPSKEEFDQLIASANVLITPSRNEGCSMLLLEALRSGSICLVCDYKHGNREIVEKGNCGFVIDHMKPQDAVRQLEDLIEHRDHYEEYYDRAYDTYKNLLSYRVWKASLEKLINEKTPHKARKTKVSEFKLSLDLKRMEWLKKNSDIRRFFEITIRCLSSFFMQYLQMKSRGKFPKKNESMLQ